MGLASDILQKISLGKSDIIQGVGSAEQFVRKNPITSSVAVAGGLLAGGTVVQILRKKRKAVGKAKTKRKATTKTKKRKSRKAPSKKKWYGKTRSNKIKMTKKGQPYVILASGKARFIKKSRAKSMKKRKGGYS